MRLGLIVAVCCLACESVAEDGELTRDQCEDMVQRIDRLESADTGGMHTSRQRTEKASIVGCLRKGTEQAHRCVMFAQSVGDLRRCDLLWR